MARIPGAADLYLHQVVNTPSLLVNVDRSRAAELGLTQRDVANTMLVTLSSSAVVAPNYWSDPRSGINYIVAVQTPQSRVDSVNSLMSTSVTPVTAGPPQLFSNLATLERREVPAVISHSNVQPVVDVYVNVQDRDLCSVAAATANSILMVTFANDQMLEGHDSRSAALAAGATRLRPVMMTALAMIIGMLPMSLGLGEGGEQNAPLGRAVIGGLSVATFATLFLVPIIYSVLRRRPPREDFLTEEESSHA